MLLVGEVDHRLLPEERQASSANQQRRTTKRASVPVVDIPFPLVVPGILPMNVIGRHQVATSRKSCIVRRFGRFRLEQIAKIMKVCRFFLAGGGIQGTPQITVRIMGRLDFCQKKEPVFSFVDRPTRESRNPNIALPLLHRKEATSSSRNTPMAKGLP